MTFYDEFVTKPKLVNGKPCLLWELQVNQSKPDFLLFCRNFLREKGFSYTGYSRDTDGELRAVFNNKYMWAGAVQDGCKVAIRIKEM